MSEVKLRELNKYWLLNEDLSVTDLRTGLTWLPKEPGRYMFDEAKALEDDSKRLPTIKEWQTAYKHGISEVFADNGTWFWSSSERTSDCAWYLHGGLGDTDSYFRNSEDGSVRCVSRK
jgi:hypothetical protein